MRMSTYVSLVPLQTPKTNYISSRMSISSVLVNLCTTYSHLQQRPSLLHQLLNLQLRQLHHQPRLKLRHQRKQHLHQPRLHLHPRPYHPLPYHPLRSHQQTYSHSNNNNNKHHPHPTVTYSQRPKLNAKKLPIVNTSPTIRGMEYVKHFKSRLTIVTS